MLTSRLASNISGEKGAVLRDPVDLCFKIINSNLFLLNMKKTEVWDGCYSGQFHLSTRCELSSDV